MHAVFTHWKRSGRLSGWITMKVLLVSLFWRCLGSGSSLPSLFLRSSISLGILVLVTFARIWIVSCLLNYLVVFLFFLILCTQVPIRCFHYGDSTWKCVMNLNIFLFAFSVFAIIASSTGALFPHYRSWLLVTFTNLNKCASHQKPYNTMERYSSERSKDSLG